MKHQNSREKQRSGSQQSSWVANSSAEIFPPENERLLFTWLYGSQGDVTDDPPPGAVSNDSLRSDSYLTEETGAQPGIILSIIITEYLTIARSRII